MAQLQIRPLDLGSWEVERKHLIGQELKPKKRGSGVLCATVAKQVFRHSVKRSAECVREECKRRCLGNDPRVYKSFHASLDDCVATAGNVSRRGQTSGKLRLSRLASSLPSSAHTPGRKRGKSRGYDIFVSQNYDNSAGASDDHAFDKRRLVDAKWRGLTDAQRAVYKHAADERIGDDSARSQEDFPEFYRRNTQVAGPRRNRQLIKSQKTQAVRATIAKMVSHPIFTGGSQIHEFDAGFRSDRVRNNLSKAEVKSQLDRIFKYDHTPAANPAAMRFFEPCKQLNGGCSKDDCFDSADILTHNLHQRCRDWKSELPLLLSFSADSSELELCVFVGKFAGRGKLIFFSPAHVRSDAGGTRRAELILDPSSRKPKAKPQTSHRAFTDFLKRWQHEQPPTTDYSQLQSLLMQRWNFRRDPDADKFRVVLDGEHSSSILHCREKVKAKPTSVDEESTGMFQMRQPSKSVSFVTLGRESKSGTAKAAKGPKGSVPSTDHRKVVDDASSHDDRYLSDCDHDHDSEQPDENLSNSEDGDSAGDEETEVVATDDVEPEPWNATGIKCWEFAGKGGKAKCTICDEKFPEGSIRLDYRFKVSTSLRDQQRFHPGCAASLPTGTRDRDTKLVRRWLRDPEVPDAAKVELTKVLGFLRE